MTTEQISTESPASTDTESDTPLADALRAALDEMRAANTAYDDMESPEDEPVGEWERRLAVAQARIGAAEHAVDAAREALADSDEPRTWILREEGEDYSEIEASSAEEALEEARGNVDRANYSDAEGTIWIDFSVRCEETGEEASGTERLDEDEPECEDGEGHDWQSPHEILGGIKENPGVWGKGGGVIVHECCIRCGCARITDTWAQRPDTGEQGLTSVSYEAGKYADEIPTREMREMDELNLCQQYVFGAAYVLAGLRDEPSERCLRDARRGTRERAEKIAAYVAKAGKAKGGYWRPQEERARRLALRLATVDDASERKAAEAIISAMGWL